MNDIVIEFKNVTKIYKLYKNDKQRFLAIFFKNIKHRNKVAVNNVSFSIKRGESVAIFGKNGAGHRSACKNVFQRNEGEIGVCH